MKIQVAVEARVDARDRRRCLTTCEWCTQDESFVNKAWCELYAKWMKTDSYGRPLRCRECLRREVKP